MRIRTNRWTVAALAAALVVAGTGCEPAPPATALVVTSTGSGSDATPGDGICEATPGVGDCTLPAAVDEGNALGEADITVTAGTYDTPDLLITGRVRIAGDVRTVQLANQEIRIAAGASLELDGAYSAFITGAHVIVEGVLHARHVSLVVIESIWPAIDVRPGGVAVVTNSVIAQAFFPGVPAVRNDGLLSLTSSAVHALSNNGDVPEALTNTGTVYSGTSLITRCSGAPPVSLGHNASPNDTCGWTGTGDITAPDLGFDLVLTAPLRYTLRSTSVLVDAAPLGANGCGDGHPDLLGVVRPVDGDGDGVAACDIGAIERPGDA